MKTDGGTDECHFISNHGVLFAGRFKICAGGTYKDLTQGVLGFFLSKPYAASLASSKFLNCRDSTKTSNII